MELRIFQKGFNYSQDGPGNRLVYHLQGCNLRCPWCSNPEGLALEGGTAVSVEELLEEAERSSLMFFENGGVTLTGGEVTLQLDAAKEFLTGLKARGISTCIETNGLNPRLPELFPVLDYLIMDVKHYDPAVHRRVTGLPNDVAVQNIRAAFAAGQSTALRIPLIGGFNASEDDARGFAALFSALDISSHATLELLTYHEYGRSKYESLGLPYQMDSTARITPEALQAFRTILTESGLALIHT